MTQRAWTPRLCTEPSCTLVHVENCPKCFGFGLVPESGAPIAAGEICWYKDHPDATWTRCPVCGGSPTEIAKTEE